MHIAPSLLRRVRVHHVHSDAPKSAHGGESLKPGELIERDAFAGESVALRRDQAFFEANPHVSIFRRVAYRREVPRDYWAKARRNRQAVVTTVVRLQDPSAPEAKQVRLFSIVDKQERPTGVEVLDPLSEFAPPVKH